MIGIAPPVLQGEGLQFTESIWIPGIWPKAVVPESGGQHLPLSRMNPPKEKSEMRRVHDVLSDLTQLQDPCRLPWPPSTRSLKHVVIRLISQWFDEPLSRDGYKCQLVKSQIVPKMRENP